MKFGSSKQSNEALNASKVTVLSLGFELKGDIISKNDIRADGVLEGNIRTDKKVVVGEKASIKGDIIADEISISGEVIGDLYINSDTVIYASARVSGKIITKQIYIHQGAILNTHIQTADANTIQSVKEASTLSKKSDREYKSIPGIDDKKETTSKKRPVNGNDYAPKSTITSDNEINESFIRSW